MLCLMAAEIVKLAGLQGGTNGVGKIKMLSDEKICEAIGWQETPVIGVWVAPNEKEYQSTPDFHNDIKACFDWLMPWLEANGYVARITHWNHRFEVDIWKKKDLISRVKDSSPSLAFIKAFSQAIENE